MKDGLQKCSSVNPIIPNQIFAQSRNPEGYLRHPTPRAYFYSFIPIGDPHEMQIQTLG